MHATIEDLIESATPVYEQMRSRERMRRRPRMVDEFTVDDCCMSQVRLDLPSLLFVWVGVLCFNAQGPPHDPPSWQTAHTCGVAGVVPTRLP